jgi:hypothetical protein
LAWLSLQSQRGHRNPECNKQDYKKKACNQARRRLF